MNVQKHKMGQAIFSHCLKIGGESSEANCPGGELSGYLSHRCTHVVIQSSQCTCAFRSHSHDVTGILQAVWRRMLIFGKRAA